MRRVVAALAIVGMAGGWAGTATSAAATSCADLGGALENSKLCHIQTTASNYAVDLLFPTDYADQQALNDYVVQNRDGFVNVAKTAPPHDRPYEMHATSEQYRSGSATSGTQSVVLKVYQDVGGPQQPSTWYQAFNYNLSSHRPIVFDTLFPADSKPLDGIYPIVQRDLEQQTGVWAILISPGAGLDPAHYQHFAITNDEVIFYFAPGELLPPSIGAPSVRVPRSAIPPLAV